MEYAVYPEYKISTNNWIGQIPQDWKEKRVKFSLSYIGSGKTPKGGANVYVSDGIKLLRSQNVYDDGLRLNDVVFITDKADDLQASTRLKADDVLLNITGASIGRSSTISINDLPANVNQHVCILRPDISNILPTYLHKLLCSVLAKSQIQASENGTSREGLNFPQVGSLFFPFPEIQEQQKIANFLDYKTQQIDQLIEKKKALIEKLNEQRIAVITQAVTKGIDKHAKIKPSGVDWLGDVPEHWEVVRAKFVSSIFIPQRNKPILNTSSGIYWTTMDDMKGDYIQATQLYVNELDAETAGSKILKSGSVIASCVGNFGITSINLVDVIINQQLQAFVPIRINLEYLKKVVSISKVYFELVGTAATLIYVNQQGFENMPVPLPPKEEQKLIVAYIEKELAQIDKLTAMSKQTIKYYQEYRSALITSAVTGKIDVRNFEIPTQKKVLV